MRKLHGPSDTSRAAADEIAPLTQELHRRVFTAIRVAGRQGRTCDELELMLGLRHQNVSARIYELHYKSRIRDSGQRRRTRGGRMAIVWVAQ